ncbi:hypothetical protein BD626DRAFT_415211 [Schizophyllum amplum]|uniref:USP domain-containing protein n=1 Tax=Schizophyllum amplum TaxID=97359 RepID=A0A550BTT5_9AGAR|nr:hypothetical protein BD626DRAFT_415211 [Auriculariopsis ampla]
MPGLHPALRWAASEPAADEIDVPFGRQKWQFASKDGTVAEPDPVAGIKRRQSRGVDEGRLAKVSRPEVGHTVATSAARTPAPPGYAWDEKDWSCPYDSLFTILRAVWVGDPSRWTPYFRNVSPVAAELASNWAAHLQGSMAWTETRDAARRHLHEQNPAAFPMGPKPASVSDLACTVLTRAPLATRESKCLSCGKLSHNAIALSQCSSLYTTNLLRGRSCELFNTSDWLTEVLKGTARAVKCTDCKSQTAPVVHTHCIPELLCLDRQSTPLVISPRVVYNGSMMTLRGIVYWGSNHFTCRVVDVTGMVYRHDGIVNGDKCVQETTLDRVDPITLGSSFLSASVECKAALVIYERTNGNQV